MFQAKDIWVNDLPDPQGSLTLTPAMYTVLMICIWTKMNVCKMVCILTGMNLCCHLFPQFLWIFHHFYFRSKGACHQQTEKHQSQTRDRGGWTGEEVRALRLTKVSGMIEDLCFGYLFDVCLLFPPAVAPDTFYNLSLYTLSSAQWSFVLSVLFCICIHLMERSNIKGVWCQMSLQGGILASCSSV